MSFAPVYLTGTDRPFPALVHLPPDGTGTGIGVVIVPPFGWEDMSSYRPRRMWAEALAAAGATVARIDLPGSGDAAGGPEDPDRVPAWVDAVGAAAAHLRLARGCRRVVAIGIGTGGMLAVEAAKAGAPVDDLVLWGVAARGRAVMRQLTVFAKMEAEARAAGGAGGTVAEDALPDGALGVGGYLLSAESAAALKALDLRDLALPGGHGRRALLLEQDGISVDAALAGALREAGVEVTEAPAHGFGKMMLEPQFSRAPQEAIATVARWLAETPAGDGPAPDPDPQRAPTAADELVDPDGGYRERFVLVPDPAGDVFGVATDPLAAPAVPARMGFLGGTGHRIGPNRMWVEAARRWAARGVPSVRLDFAGIGDAGGEPPPDVPSLYQDIYVGQLRRVLDAVAQPEDRTTVPVALCAAAYWAVQTSLADERRVVPFMLNPGMLSWDADEHHAHLRRHYRKRLLKLDTYRRLLRGEVSWTNAPRAVLNGVLAAVRQVVARVTRRGGDGAPAAATATAAPARPGTPGVLDALQAQGTPALMVLTGDEPILDELRRDGGLGQVAAQWPGLRFEIIEGEVDLHTLRPLWLQRRVHAMLDAALAAELDGLGLAVAAR
jgi:hypothetical protein